ncbi:MAG: ATP-grasp domain-containing protein [Angustibacter sp.]
MPPGTVTVPADARRVLILGGAGTVGRWAAQHLAGPGDRVVTVDRGGCVDLHADVVKPDLALREAVAAAGTIVLALPEGVALGCAGWLPAAISAHAVLVSTCSVQKPLFTALSLIDPLPLLIGVNPMFSPTLDSVGRPVALIRTTPVAASESLRQCLIAGDMTVTELTPDEHDEAMSYLQVLPHAVLLAYLQALVKAPVELAILLRLAPPPARTLLALVCRILSSPPEIYWDIQHANAAGAARRQALRQALDDLDTTVAARDFGRFQATLAAASHWLGEQVSVSAQECSRLFDLPPVALEAGAPGSSRDRSARPAHVAVFGDLFDVPERARAALGETRITAFVQRSRMARCDGLDKAQAVVALPDDAPAAEWAAAVRAVHTAHPITHAAALVDHLAREAARALDEIGVAFHHPDTMTSICDKAAMRAALDEQGRYPVRHRLVHDLPAARRAAAELGLPCVVKPTTGTGSLDVAVVRSVGQVEVAYLQAAGRDGAALVEAYAVGPQYSVEAMSEDGEHVVLTVTRKYSDPSSLVELGHVMPAPLAPDEYAAIARCATDVLDAVRLRYGPSHTEVVLSPSGPVPIETHARVGGDDLWLMVQAACGVDLDAAQPAQILGEPVLADIKATLAGRPPDRPFQAVWFGATRTSTPFDGLTVPGHVSDDEHVTVTSLWDKGGKTRPLSCSDDRVFKVRATGTSADEALRLAVEAAAAVAGASGLDVGLTDLDATL